MDTTRFARFAAAALLVPALAGAASFFHLALKGAEPAQGGSVAASPAALKLWFTEAPEVAVTKVALATAGGAAVKLGAVARDTAAARKGVVVAVPSRLAAGAYTVTWSTMSHDGHPVKGSYGFTVTH